MSVPIREERQQKTSTGVWPSSNSGLHFSSRSCILWIIRSSTSLVVVCSHRLINRTENQRKCIRKYCNQGNSTWSLFKKIGYVFLLSKLIALKSYWPTWHLSKLMYRAPSRRGSNKLPLRLQYRLRMYNKKNSRMSKITKMQRIQRAISSLLAIMAYTHKW